ncbi:MAG: HAMP domain-containing histidine kinase [Oscillatoria princeps RMCB-10]|jgi:signal transduction histidine kinase|nr:HAMP domain-containing histidine kinase [Oscillatoria princeps RMCB-10]
MRVGAERIRQIVLSLRNFSRLDEADMKQVDIHSGIDSTLLILQHRLKDKAGSPGIEVIKEFGELPNVECYAGQLNQVFVNILTNAIDALEGQNRSAGVSPGRTAENLAERRIASEAIVPSPRIRIRTEVLNSNRVAIRIADNGPGMSEEVCRRLFDPFFTTKPVGSGTGLGLSISYQIVVEKHRGQLKCISVPGQGAEFIIEIPLTQGNQLR